MARPNLGSMSVEALMKLRDEIEKVLNQRAVHLQSQLSRLGGEIGQRGRRSSLKGTKVPVKYRDKAGNTWAGRGRSPSGCERRSRRVPSSTTLPFKKQRLLAKLRPEKQRSAAARSERSSWLRSFSPCRVLRSSRRSRCQFLRPDQPMANSESGIRSGNTAVGCRLLMATTSGA